MLADSEEMWVHYRESRNMVTSAIRSTKRRYFMHNILKAALLMKPDCPSAKWWKAAKELTARADCGREGSTSAPRYERVICL